MSKKVNQYAVIMAGGIGSRFWPISTEDRPKQFYDILNQGSSLLQMTYTRLEKIIPSENILILTNVRYKAMVKEQLKMLKDENILLEPKFKNTAPCLLYATFKIQKRNPEASILVASSDHWIGNENAFQNAIATCFNFCEKKQKIILLGINPKSANTGYGYIEIKKTDSEFKQVKQFIEKPNKQTAERYYKSGVHFWNAGIFIFSVKTLLSAFMKYKPEMYTAFNTPVYNTLYEKDFIEDVFLKTEKVSIDYAIIEKIDNAYVLPVSMDWSDLGTWGSLYNKLPKDKSKNVLQAESILVTNSFKNVIKIDTPNKKVLIDGMEDMIVVDTESSLLIFPKSKEQDLKKEVSKLLKK